MCRNPEVEKEIVEKVSTFIKVDDFSFNSKRKQNDPKLEINARKILKSNPEITTEQDLANYLLEFVIKCQLYFLGIAKLLLNDKYLKLFSVYFEIHQRQLLNPRCHLSAYLDEVCYWQALKIYDKLRPYNYSLEKNEIFLIARAVAANPEVFKGYDFRRASLKTFAGKVISGKVLDKLRKGREKEKYSDTALLVHTTKTELENCLNQAISNSSKVERYLLAWQCFKEIYVPIKQEGNRRLEPPSNEQLQDIAQLYQNRSSQQEQITSEEIARLLKTCVQAIRQANIITVESIDAINIEQDWENITKNETTNEGEYLELHQQISVVLVNEIDCFLDEINSSQERSKNQKILELILGLSLTQQEVGNYFLMIHYTNVGRKLKKHGKELLFTLSLSLLLLSHFYSFFSILFAQNQKLRLMFLLFFTQEKPLDSEKLNLIHQYIVQFVNNYCTNKFGDFLSEMICQKSSETINLLEFVYKQYSGDIRKATEYLKASEYEKNNNNELEEVKPQFKIENESDLENELEIVKQKLQSELETYVANNYSSSLLESESVKNKIATFIENYLYEYPYANIH
ncbi:MAG: hypothetical protein AAGF26_05705 [Cyanobacteria bacterium P01_G01_bin.49]